MAGTKRDPQPEDEAARWVQRGYAQARFRFLRWWRQWLAMKLLGLVGLGSAGVILAAVNLPTFAAALCAAVTALALVYAIFARRIMENERNMRRAFQVRDLRRQEEILKARNTVLVTAIALDGDPDALRDPSLPPQVRSAMMRVRQRLAQAEATARHPLPTNARSRRPAVAELEPLKARHRALVAELQAVREELQAVYAGTDEEVEVRVEMSKERLRSFGKAAREADNLAWERRMQGLSPTAPAGSERSLEISFSPVRGASVRPAAPQRTPEQIIDEVLDEPAP